MNFGDLSINLGALYSFSATCTEVAVNILFQIKIFQNTTFGHRTDVPTVTF